MSEESDAVRLAELIEQMENEAEVSIAACSYLDRAKRIIAAGFIPRTAPDGCVPLTPEQIVECRKLFENFTIHKLPYDPTSQPRELWGVSYEDAMFLLHRVPAMMEAITLAMARAAELRAAITYSATDSWDFGTDMRMNLEYAATAYDLAFGSMTNDQIAAALIGLRRRFDRAAEDAVNKARKQAKKNQRTPHTVEVCILCCTELTVAQARCGGSPFQQKCCPFRPEA